MKSLFTTLALVLAIAISYGQTTKTIVITTELGFVEQVVPTNPDSLRQTFGATCITKAHTGKPSYTTKDGVEYQLFIDENSTFFIIKEKDGKYGRCYVALPHDAYLILATGNQKDK